MGWRYIFSLRSADESQSGRNSCPLLRSCFIGSCHVGVSKRFSFTFTFFLPIRSLVDATLVAFIVCGPLQFVLLTKEVGVSLVS